MTADYRLEPLADASPPEGPLVLVVLDGVGIGRKDEGDAVHLARTPVLDRLHATCPHLPLRAHGRAVGMPSDSDMGNSEVGHNALGCGRVFDQGAKLVDAAIESGAIFDGEVWKEVVERGRSGGAVHLVGLLSDGNVHSHIDQIFALIREADRAGVGSLRVHPLLDGRDVGETSALTYVDALEEVLGEIDAKPDRSYRIASGGGRMLVTMDRYEADWSIVERGYRAHVHGDARAFPSARAAIEAFRAEKPGVIDQFLPAFVVADEHGPVGPIRDGDAVVFVNFRGDRAIEISRAFEEEDFPYFDRGRRPAVLYAGLMEYDGDLHIPSRYLVEPPAIDRTLTQHLAASGVVQLAVAETQKYGHVTYFWNGNCAGLYDPERDGYVDVPARREAHETYSASVRRTDLETYVEIESDRVPYEQRPWMKAAEVTDALLDELRTGRYRFARVNYANGDMVGHTGVREAAIVAMEAVDLCLGRVLEVVTELGGEMLVLADHGNADEMYMIDKKTGEFVRDESGRPKPKTSHTLNPVSCVLYAPDAGLRLAAKGDEPGLANVAATVLELLGYRAPAGYLPSLLASR